MNKKCLPFEANGRTFMKYKDIEEIEVGVLDNNHFEINGDDGSDSELPSLDF